MLKIAKRNEVEIKCHRKNQSFQETSREKIQESIYKKKEEKRERRERK